MPPARLWEMRVRFVDESVLWGSYCMTLCMMYWERTKVLTVLDVEEKTRLEFCR